MPIVVSVAASALASLCAVADGSLLALDADDSTLTPALRELAQRREHAHRALAFARVAAHLAAGSSIAIALVDGLGPRGNAALVAIAIGVVAVLVSESVARSAGDDLGARAARVLLPVTRAVTWILSPVIRLGALIERGLHTILPQRADTEEERDASAEQFREVVAAEAEVSREEAALLHGVFELGDTEVHEVMVPRVDILGIDRDTPWSEAVDRLRSSEHARLPVYADTIDDIVGILYAKDVLPAVVEGPEPDGGWQRIVRSAEFIPRTKSVDEQLRAFQAGRSHIAIVVDEFGGTAGLVTIEDILEEIVGEIRDEYDVEEPPIVIEGDGRRVWVSGLVTLDEFSDAIGHDLRRESVTTVGGLVFDQLGRVPRNGEQFSLDGFRVIVERVRRRRIERVYFERTLTEDAEPA